MAIDKVDDDEEEDGRGCGVCCGGSSCATTGGSWDDIFVPDDGSVVVFCFGTSFVVVDVVKSITS